jgi:hypothetical protein
MVIMAAMGELGEEAAMAETRMAEPEVARAEEATGAVVAKAQAVEGEVPAVQFSL